MSGKHAKVKCIISAILAFNLFGFASTSYAESSSSVEVNDAPRVDVEQLVGSVSESVVDGSLLSEAETVSEPSATPAVANPASAEIADAPASDTEAESPNSGLSYAQPSENDFEFDLSSRTITELKTGYVASLTAEQKKDIRLIIPAEINGVAVECIGKNAFYSSTNRELVFTQLDLSQTTSLRSIGSNAFRYANKLVGDLILPDSITTLGESAFADCGYNGILRLPHNSAFTAIPLQAFSGTPFTGTLEIPASVISLGKSAFSDTLFSGSLEIPEGVEEMWSSAFAGCKNITSVSIPSTLDFKSASTTGQHFQGCASLEQITFASSSNVTTLYSQMFTECKNLKVLYLPDSVTSFDAKAFYNCGLKTIYLPAHATVTANAGSFLYACDNAVAVCPDEASYAWYKTQFGTAQQKYLGYPTTVSFDAGSYGKNPPVIDRLSGQAFNRIKDAATGIWAVDAEYELPNLVNDEQPGFTTPWSFVAAPTVAITASSVIQGTSPTLKAGQPVLVEPEFEYEEIYKVYDGKESYLKVKGSHPLAKEESAARVGDYVFYYAWVVWDSVTSPGGKIVKQGFDNTFGLTDVADSTLQPYRYYTVQSYLYQKTATGWVKAKGSYTQFLYALISPAQPDVRPVLSADEPSNLEGFPGLTLAEGSSPGSITWNAEQALTEGTHAYAWTYTPDVVADKAANYKTATGTFDVRVVDGEVVSLVSFDTCDGEALDSIDVALGETLPADTVAVRDGYVFSGWYKDEAYSQPWKPEDRVLQSMTLYARWGRSGSVVLPSGGTLVVDGKEVDVETAAIGINHKLDVTPKAKEALESLEGIKLPEGGSEVAGFFELNLVVGGQEYETAEFGGSPPVVTISFPVAADKRYTVIHLKHDGTLESIDSKADSVAGTLSFAVGSLSPFMVLSQASQTSPTFYAVTFDSKGGHGPESIMVSAGTSMPVPKDPTRLGFKFAGWFTDEVCAQEWDFDSPVSGAMTLYAKWELDPIPDPTPDPSPDPGGPDDPDNPVDPDEPGDPSNPDNPSDLPTPSINDSVAGNSSDSEAEMSGSATTPHNRLGFMIPRTGDDALRLLLLLSSAVIALSVGIYSVRKMRRGRRSK